MSLFIIHLTIVINSLLNFVDSCFQGGLRVLYAVLFIFFINPLVLFVFDKGTQMLIVGFTGLCKEKSNLKWFVIGQPILSVFFIIISIVNVFGFNGFIRVSQLFNEGHGFAGVIAVIISIVFLGVGLFSGFIYVRVMRGRGELTSDL